jgi:hypothetical protein
MLHRITHSLRHSRPGRLLREAWHIATLTWSLSFDCSLQHA